MKKNIKTSKNEFRYNYKTQHMNFVFEQDGNNYHSLGLTHEKRTNINNKWHKNMPLKQNLQKNKKDKSYIRFGYITQNKNTFGKIDKRFVIKNGDDKSNIKSKVRHFKNERRKRQ